MEGIMNRILWVKLVRYWQENEQVIRLIIKVQRWSEREMRKRGQTHTPADLFREAFRVEDKVLSRAQYRPSFVSRSTTRITSVEP